MNPEASPALQGGSDPSKPARIALLDDELRLALDTVKAAGHVVLKEKSYRQAQERQRVADVMRAHAEEDAEHARAWARDCLTEERRLRERLTFVWGIAQAHGATVEELSGP